jgi:uncharacterized damage-inducible protein DinB
MSSTATPDLEQLRFPVGRFDPKAGFTSYQRGEALDSIAGTPARMRAAVAGLNDEQLDTPYREGGWTVRQVVHHVPDSHMNAYVRFKLALTEETPMIKTYEEAAWAKLADSRETPIEVSLSLLDALHVRFDKVLRAMSDEDFQRKLQHPEWGDLELSTMVRLYEWHGRHHVAHITRLRDRNDW